MKTNKYGNIPLTQEEIEFIKTHYQGTTRKEMCELLYKEFGVVHCDGQVKNIYSKYNLKSNRTGRFPKGHTPWTKGKKKTDFMTAEQIENQNTKRIEAVSGENNDRYKPIGSKYVSKRGDVIVKIGENTWEREHIVVWEKVHGKLKDGEKIIHLDGNRLNNDIDNLAIITNHELKQVYIVMGLTDNAELNETILNIAKLNTQIRNKEEKWKP